MSAGAPLSLISRVQAASDSFGLAWPHVARSGVGHAGADRRLGEGVTGHAGQDQEHPPRAHRPQHSTTLTASPPREVSL